jgi:hypothetical protein
VQRAAILKTASTRGSSEAGWVSVWSKGITVHVGSRADQYGLDSALGERVSVRPLPNQASAFLPAEQASYSIFRNFRHTGEASSNT